MGGSAGFRTLVSSFPSDQVRAWKSVKVVVRSGEFRKPTQTPVLLVMENLRANRTSFRSLLFDSYFYFHLTLPRPCSNRNMLHK